MRFGSVCSGIEAASTAWNPLGWKAAWFSEIEPFPSAVLAHHHPDVPNLGDMTLLPALIRAGTVEAPDVFCGGTPCQAFSVAGKRQSLNDARGNLSLTFCEIANAIDDIRHDRGEHACIVFWENVPGVLSTKDNAFGCFLAQLCGGDEPLYAPDGWPDAGCVSGERRTAAWRVLDAQYFGLAQRRRRVFVVASARDGFDPAAVLFEFDGVRRDSAPSREAGKGTPASTARSTGGGGLGTGFDCDGGVIQQSIAFEPGLLKRESTHFYHEHAGTIRSGPGDNAMAVASVLVAFHPTQDPISSTGVCHALGAGNGQGCASAAVAYSIMPMNSGKDYRARETDVAQPLVAGGPVGGNQGRDFIAQAVEVATVMQAMQVRRLTPVECERLQGFPDGYTAIPWRKKPASECPDGPRYKSLGNSWAVPVVAWIGTRIHNHLKEQA